MEDAEHYTLKRHKNPTGLPPMPLDRTGNKYKLVETAGAYTYHKRVAFAERVANVSSSGSDPLEWLMFIQQREIEYNRLPKTEPKLGLSGRAGPWTAHHYSYRII
jgi:hypothetical protein